MMAAAIGPLRLKSDDVMTKDDNVGSFRYIFSWDCFAHQYPTCPLELDLFMLIFKDYFYIFYLLMGATLSFNFLNKTSLAQLQLQHQSIKNDVQLS